MEIKEGQLVSIKYLFRVDSGELISTNMNYNYEQGYKRDFDIRKLTIWVRVKFIDLDGLFCGEVERVERNTWSDAKVNLPSKGQQVIIKTDRVLDVEDMSRQFCYSDNVTQCDCPGLCREK